MNERIRTEARDRLRRITGQLDGIARMLEENRPATDLLVQLSSAQAAVRKVAQLVLQAYLESGLREVLASRSAKARTQRIAELAGIFSRYGDPGAN